MPGDEDNRDSQGLRNWLALAALLALGIVWAPEPPAAAARTVPAGALPAAVTHLAAAASPRTR